MTGDTWSVFVSESICYSEKIKMAQMENQKTVGGGGGGVVTHGRKKRLMIREIILFFCCKL